MHLSIYAIGKMRAAAELPIVETYLKRAADIGRALRFDGPTLNEFEAPKGLSGVKRQEKEKEWMLSAANGARLITLDEHGKNITSTDFAKLIESLRDDGIRQTAFLIGGADGHHRDIIAKTDHRIAFGAATWPHMLVRAMLTEQLYRAMTILSGHPYHRA